MIDSVMVLTAPKDGRIGCLVIRRNAWLANDANIPKTDKLSGKYSHPNLLFYNCFLILSSLGGSLILGRGYVN